MMRADFLIGLLHVQPKLACELMRALGRPLGVYPVLVVQGVGQGKIPLVPLAQDGKGGFEHTLNELNPLGLSIR